MNELRRLVCRVRGHRPRKGTNGWEMFGSGLFCSTCGTMVEKDGRESRYGSGAES